MRKTLVLLSLAPAVLFAQVEHAREVTKTLCSPEFHGRGYVNGGDSIAAEFIAQQFTEAGCSFFPAGKFQPFSFNVNTFPGEMALAVDGHMLVPGVDYIVDPSSGGGTKTSQRVYKLPVEAIFNHDLLIDELKALKMPDPEFGNRELPVILLRVTGLKGDSLKTASRLAVSLAQEFTVLQVSDTKFTWSVSDEQYKNPLIHVQQSVFDLTKPELSVDFDIKAVLRSHQARNVVAYAPAKRRSKRYIVFTAHYDHLGQMGNATYFPGGNDNASGTAMLLELARYFQTHPLRKTNVAFFSFAGEEAGLIGSHYYVEHPVFPLKNIEFLTNVDIMGSGEDGITVVNATLFPEKFKELEQINSDEKLLSKVAQRGPAANSDHYFFTEAGVPAFFIYTMGPNRHYHDIEDTYEELSFSEFGDIFRLLVEFAQQ